jgi:hypothetical protein
MSTAFLMELRTLGEPLLQNAIFVHGHLERWTQANVRFDFGLGFLLKPREVFCRQLCDKQFKLEFLLTLFQTSQGDQLFFQGYSLKAGHYVTSITYGEDLMALSGQGQRIDLR